MKDNMKDCFTPHVMMHSLIGLGLGLIIAHFWMGLAGNVWYGVALVVTGAVLDFMRK